MNNSRRINSGVDDAVELAETSRLQFEQLVRTEVSPQAQCWKVD